MRAIGSPPYASPALPPCHTPCHPAHGQLPARLHMAVRAYLRHSSSRSVERTEMKGGQEAPVGGPSKSKSGKSSRAAPSSADLYWTCTGLVLDLYCAQVPRALRALGEGAPSASQGSARAQGAPGWLKAVRHRAPNSQIKKGPKVGF